MRFLVQSVDHKTEEDFREWLIKTFGVEKGRAATICQEEIAAIDGIGWHGKRPGFAAYLYDKLIGG